MHHEAQGWAWVAGLYIACLVLHVLVPVSITRGYVCDCKTRQVLLYRHNGFRVLVSVLVLLGAGTAWGALPPLAKVGQWFWPICRASCAYGVLVSTVLYMRGLARIAAGRVDKAGSCLTTSSLATVTTATGSVGVDARSDAARDSSEFDGRSLLEHFYCGIEWNPRISVALPLSTSVDVDIKMLNYLVGAVGLACNVLAALALHMEARGIGMPPSNAMIAYCIPMLWFVCEYLWFEDVHVYTYDIFRERTGFKMCWGCWCFYPCFYCVGAWCLVAPGRDTDISIIQALNCISLFFVGWLLTRGANMQKHAWRTHQLDLDLARVGHTAQREDGGRVDGGWWCPLGAFGPRVRQHTIPGSRGRLLCSGFWGAARHINYLGEVLQGTALALPGFLATGSFVPFLYPLYYVLLFVGRQQDDDVICAAKYGAAWDAYCAAVPYRIVPLVY